MRHRLVVMCALVAVLGVGARPVGASNPTIPANRPTPLAGETNGEVSPTRLIHVIPNCVAAREAAPSLMRLFTMARQAGVPLAAEECYRTLANEVKYANIANQPGNNPACVASVGTAPSGKPVGHSMHGWGKAADLIDFGGSLTFGSPAYAFMKQNAWRVGWNHPAFAEPGGSSCPEPWHWEWVGDGGNLHLGARRGDAVTLLPSSDNRGAGVVDGLGGVTPHGSFKAYPGPPRPPQQWVTVGAAATPGERGYWTVTANGSVYTYGTAHFHGSLGARHLSAPINGMTASHSGRGYYLVAWDGGIFTFGDAKFRGSTGAMHLNRPIVGMAVTPSGRGYWLVASDGGIFTFGDARFYGSTGSLRLVSPIVGMAPTPSGRGYWLVASDGGVFTFGDARFHGSLAQVRPVAPIVGILPLLKTGGARYVANYRLLLADGSISGPNDPRRRAVP